MTARWMGSLVFGLLVVGLASAAHATSYAMMYDGDLHDQARVVARVEVLAASPAPVFGAPATDYIVLVEKLLKGQVSGTSVVVRVPGGVRADGLGLRIFGAPELTVGKKALLFLAPRNDGTYGVMHLMLGAFFEASDGELRTAVRQLSEARVVDLEREGDDEPRYVRDWQRFENWLGDRTNGIHREPDYLARESRTVGAVYQPSLLTFEEEPIRFFEFDDGGELVWKVGRGLSKAKKNFKRATKAWNADPDTVVRLKRKGRTSSNSGLSASDGINAIVFNDPNRSLEGVFDCRSGGVVAVGGVWFFQSPVLVRKIPKGIGKGKANVAIEADIVTNDGSKCLLSDSKSAEQVFGHELGHTLGLAHSCDDAESGACRTEEKADALMRAVIHRDNRGARLGAWDRKWLGKLY